MKDTHRPGHEVRINQCIDQPVSASKYAATILQDNASVSFRCIFTGAVQFASEMIKQDQMCL